ncbi:MAG: hypothetical protein MJD61_05560 [Proteobacteria bacterium]|nr:hypothetical protein [Pseudomonadota bacterium]
MNGAKLEGMCGVVGRGVVGRVVAWTVVTCAGLSGCAATEGVYREPTTPVLVDARGEPIVGILETRDRRIELTARAGELTVADKPLHEAHARPVLMGPVLMGDLSQRVRPASGGAHLGARPGVGARPGASPDLVGSPVLGTGPAAR